MSNGRVLKLKYLMLSWLAEVAPSKEIRPDVVGTTEAEKKLVQSQNEFVFNQATVFMIWKRSSRVV